GQQGMALHLDVLDRAAAPGAVDQAHQRQAQVVRHLLAGDRLVAHGTVIGAAAHREVVADHDDRATLDPAAPGDQVRGHEPLEAPFFVVLPGAGKLAEFAETVRVEQLVDALAHWQSAVVAVALEFRLASHLFGEPMAMRELFELLFPSQGTVSGYGDAPQAAHGTREGPDRIEPDSRELN